MSVRASAFRQPQPRIQRHRLDALAFSRPVHHPVQGKIPEDRPIRPAMRFGQALHHPPVGQLQRLATVSITGQGERLNMDSRLLRTARPNGGQELHWTGYEPPRLKAPDDDQPSKSTG